jgi:flavodoxin
MKTLLIYVSIHHGNTEKIAKAMANVLEAKLMKPLELDVNDVTKYDLIGFGSGIYDGEHHKTLLNFADKLAQLQNKKAFIFSTKEMGPVRLYHKSLRNKLLERNFDIIGEFSCKGFIDYSLTKYIFGGLNKKRPNEKDLENARKFAEELKNKEE